MRSLSKAKALAVTLTNERKIDHVVVKNGYLYDVVMANKWAGSYVEKIKYNKPIGKAVVKEKKPVQ